MKLHSYIFLTIESLPWITNHLLSSLSKKLSRIRQRRGKVNHRIKSSYKSVIHDQDDVKENNGKRYFFDSHIAGSWGTEYNGYRIIEVFENGQKLTYQMNPAPMKG